MLVCEACHRPIGTSRPDIDDIPNWLAKQGIFVLTPQEAREAELVELYELSKPYTIVEVGYAGREMLFIDWLASECYRINTDITRRAEIVLDPISGYYSLWTNIPEGLRDDD